MSGVFDYVVIGAGSAGCALAARLARDPDCSVLLLEAGASDGGFWSRMPAGNGFLFGDPRHDWGFSSLPQQALGGRRIYYPRGKGLGGSSLMNGMIYMRGCAADYDRWRDRGLPGWSFAEVLPYFKRAAAAAHRTGDPFHGQDGPLRLTPAGNFDAINKRFVAACVEAGAPENPDFNGASQRGVGRLDATVWNGRRQSSAAAYLARPRRNLTVRKGARARALAFEKNRCVGVRLEGGVIRARRETILSSGAFQSPQLLMLSGVGPADHLRAHGIAVRCDLPGVGARLFDHPTMPMKVALADPRLSMARLQRIDRAVLMGLRYLARRDGAGAAPFWSAALFESLRDRDAPELEIYMTPMIVKEEAAGFRFTLDNLMNIGALITTRGKTAAPGLQFDINLQRPKSAGSVRLASADPDDAPLIDPNWFEDPDDLADLVAAVRRMREIARKAPLAEVLGREIAPGPDAESDAAIAAAIRRSATTGHHPVSTCRMGGEDDPGAVLDHALRVRGVDGLRVVDASSFPDQISGNPNAPIMMLAEKAADMILGHAPLPAEDPRPGARSGEAA